jgi:hypothetical protein
LPYNTQHIKEEKEHSGVIHIMYTKEHTLYELHQNVLFLLLYVECCMTTWCIKNLHTCSFVYIHSGVIHIMYTKEHVYKFLIHQVAIQHSKYKRKKKNILV